ncbi:hypothetical protein [Mannheimia haemolytica]|uniref:hypothetical protein n=1 Tax=Mannheimia haemolytica TaxID=75985 RepID=UPI0039FD153A
MKKLHLDVPKYIVAELEHRGIDVNKTILALYLDSTTMIDLFSNFIQTEEGGKILEQETNNGYFAFCLEEEISLIFGCAFIEQKTLLNVKILPFSKDTTDSYNDIIDEIIKGEVWSLCFKYDTILNEPSDMQINWDILLKTDLEKMVDNFINYQNKSTIH